jgi:hypothetical protein
MRSIKAVFALVLFVLAVPMFGAAYIKFDGIDGESKAPGHATWLEVQSVQFAEGACSAPTGAPTGVRAPRRATIELKEVPAALAQACSSRQTIANAIVDVDGRRQTLQNVTLECPAPAATKLSKASKVVIRVDFMTCSEPAAAGHVKVFDGSSVQLIGLSPTPVDGKIMKTTLRGNTATATFARDFYRQFLGRQPDAAAFRKVSKIDSFTIKQTVAMGKIIFEDVVISSFVDAPEGATLTFEFARMTGAPSDYLRLGGQ